MYISLLNTLYTANMWYYFKDTKTCQHPTLTPQIASRLGQKTTTGVIERCTDLNCLDCRYNKTACLPCDTANSYYYTGLSYADAITPSNRLPCSRAVVRTSQRRVDGHCTPISGSVSRAGRRATRGQAILACTGTTTLMQRDARV